MILIGTMEWASTVERGDFFCPACNAAKNYQRKVARPFLTLYFIPVIPIGAVREFKVRELDGRATIVPAVDLTTIQDLFVVVSETK